MRAAGVWVCGALAVLAACSPAAPAQATAGLEPGVHLAPGSPAEKEYVLTLNQARQTGASPSSHASTSPQLFGSGITPPSGGAGSSSASSHAPARPAGERKGAASAPAVRRTHQAASLPAAVLRATRAPDSSAGGGSTVALVAGGLAVLVLGGFGGTVLRHSRRATPPA